MAFLRLVRKKVPAGDGFGGCPLAGKITKVSPNDATRLSLKVWGEDFPVDANVPKRSSFCGLKIEPRQVS